MKLKNYLAVLLCGCAVSVSAGSPAPVELSSFVAEAGKFYRVEAELENSGNAVLELRYFNIENQDLEEIERALGFPVSTRSAACSGEGRLIRLAGPAGSSLVKPARGKILLRGKDAAKIKVRALRLFDTEETEADESSGLTAASPAPEQKFPANPVPDPSFEEGGSWSWTGPGELRFSCESYAGERALLLTPADNGGRAVSMPFKLLSRDPVRLFYFIKFSRYANPMGGPEPLRIEFLKRDSSGAFTVVPDPGYHEFPQSMSAYYGRYFPLLSRPVEVPAGATHARLFAEHRDNVNIWSGPARRNLGEILIDNIAFCQFPATDSDESVSKS